METMFSEIAKAKQRDFLKEAEHEKWLMDARSKGYKINGPVSSAVRKTLVRLVTTIGLFA